MRDSVSYKRGQNTIIIITVGPRFYPRSRQQEKEDKIEGTLKEGFFKLETD